MGRFTTNTVGSVQALYNLTGSVSASANVTSIITDLKPYDNVGLVFNWSASNSTASLSGSMVPMISNDKINFTDLTTATPFIVSSSAGVSGIEINQSPYHFIQFQFRCAAGSPSGSVSSSLYCKSVGD